MITGGYSIQGKSHIETGKVCQDSHQIADLKNGWYLAIVADGVGSAKHSEIGSSIAVTALEHYCKNHIDTTYNDTALLETLHAGYHYAYKQIVQYVSKNKGKIEEYDTTLSCALYNGKKVIWGHAGDGGILVKNIDGTFQIITSPQKGLDGISVRPLRAGESSWEFATYKNNVAGVLLFTDGMLEGVFMPSLLNVEGCTTVEEVSRQKNKKVAVNAAQFFLNPDCVYKNRNFKNIDQTFESLLTGDFKDIQEIFSSALQNAYTKMFGKAVAREIVDSFTKYSYIPWALNRVTDDKTIVWLINDKCQPKLQKPDYYMDPDWKELKNTYQKILNGESIVSSDKTGNISNNMSLHDEELHNLRKRLKKSSEKLTELETEFQKMQYKRNKFDILILIAFGIILGSSIGILGFRNHSITAKNRQITDKVVQLETSLKESETEQLTNVVKIKEQTNKLNKLQIVLDLQEKSPLLFNIVLKNIENYITDIEIPTNTTADTQTEVTPIIKFSEEDKLALSKEFTPKQIRQIEREVQQTLQRFTVILTPEETVIPEAETELTEPTPVPSPTSTPLPKTSVTPATNISETNITHN